jgi:4-amino-4-deoxy-L-arabinose transferase-like glycosyltransferase
MTAALDQATSGTAATSQPSPRTWHEIAVLFAILVTAGVLRFYRITANSFWTDELFTVQSTSGVGLGATLDLPVNVVLDPAPVPTAMGPLRPWWHTLQPDGHDNNPPLFYLLTRGWVTVFGYSERSFRAHAAVWSIAAVSLLYLVVRWRTGSAAPALWSAAMMALAEQHIQLAQTARCYSMLVALCLAAGLALTAIEMRGATNGRAVILGLAILAALLTHYTAVGVLVALNIYALLVVRGSQRRAVVAASIAAICAFGLLWGRGLWLQHRVQGFADPVVFTDHGSGHFVRTLWRFALLPAMFLGQPPPGWDRIAAVGVFLVPIALVVAVSAKGRSRRRDALLWSLWFAAATLPTLGADLARGTLRLDIIRYTILASPAVYALISSLTIGLRPLLRHLLPATAVLSCALTASLAYNDTFLPDWRRVASKIASVAQPGDLIVVAPNTADAEMSRMWAMLCTHYLRPMPGPLMVLTAPHGPELRPTFARYGGVVVITDDPDRDGIRARVTPKAFAYDVRLGEIYRFEP